MPLDEVAVKVVVDHYDDLDEHDQAAVRADWDRRIGEARTNLDLEEEFIRTGRTWTDADADGRAITRNAAPDPE